MNRVGIIGFGHLGSSIADGLLKEDRGSDLVLDVYDVRPDALPSGMEVTLASSAEELVRDCDFIFLCVRPSDARALLESLKAPDKVIISAVAGLEAADIAAATGARVLRIMPNMAVSLGEGAIACAEPNDLSPEELRLAESLLSRLGKTVFVPENALAAVTGLSGSGPAYCYMLLEGMVKGARLAGLKEDAARELATQTMIGAGSVVEATDESLESLISSVATPGGTTAEGVRVLNIGAFEILVQIAVQEAAKRARELAGDGGERGNEAKTRKEYAYLSKTGSPLDDPALWVEDTSTVTEAEIRELASLFQPESLAFTEGIERILATGVEPLVSVLELLRRYADAGQYDEFFAVIKSILALGLMDASEIAGLFQGSEKARAKLAREYLAQLEELVDEFLD